MRKQSSNQLPAPFDNAAKLIFQQRPADVIKFATGYESPIIEPLRGSLEIRRKREVDVLAKIQIPSARNPKRLIWVIVHIEFQTEPVLIMPYRMAEYIGRIIRVYQLPVISVVIYLREKKIRKPDPGFFQQTYPTRFLAEWKVMRLWELDGQNYLDNPTPGNLPFIPLMKPAPGYHREAWLQRCVDVAQERIPLDQRADVFYSMDVLSGLVIKNQQTVNLIIPEEIMKESVTYQHIVNKAKTEMGSSLLLSHLGRRFDSIPKTISDKIKTIEDEQILLKIQDLVIDAENKQEFLKAFRALTKNES